MNKKVLGLDISRNYAVCYCLETIPENPKEYFSNFPIKEFQRDKRIYKYQSQVTLLENNAKGLKAFLEIAPDVIVLEPTGYYYSAFWAHHAKNNDIQVEWISHQGLAASRKHYGFKNKTDDIDAFCIALSYLDPTTPRDRFLKVYHFDLMNEIKSLAQERQRCVDNRIRGSNQLRQFLCLEFPEIAERNFDYIGKLGFNPTLGHIANLAPNPRIRKVTSGLGISPRSERLALEIMELMTREETLEGQLETLFQSRECKPYTDVLKNFGFRTPTIATILPRIYPIEKFMTDGKIQRNRGHHNLSLRAFQAYLGLAYEYEKSGDGSAISQKTKKKWHGSTPTRSDFYAWLLANPVAVSKYKPKNPIQEELLKYWLHPRRRTIFSKTRGIRKIEVVVLPSLQSLGKDGICRFLFILTRLLWRELVKELDMIEF